MPHVDHKLQELTTLPFSTSFILYLDTCLHLYSVQLKDILTVAHPIQTAAYHNAALDVNANAPLHPHPNPSHKCCHVRLQEGPRRWRQV